MLGHDDVSQVRDRTWLKGKKAMNYLFDLFAWHRD
jgi:hypothetical protein